MTAASPAPEFVDAVRQALSLGLARVPLPPAGFVAPDHPDAALKIMAIAGQAQRFIRSAPPSFDLQSSIKDHRRILPEAARSLLLALDLKGESPAALAIADRIEAGGWCPHPFDLPRLASFAKPYAERLGPATMAFFAEGADSASLASDPFNEALDESNWTEGTLARKAAFIRTARIADPARARGLAEAAFTGQNAASRLRILEAFRTGLSGDDLPFLENLAGDRAPTVKALAAKLIARIPGSAPFEAQLQEAMSRIKRGTAGFLRRKTRLAIEPPANVHPAARRSWAIDAFAAAPLDSFASHFGLTIDQLVEAAADDVDLTCVLLRRAIVEGRFPLAGRLAADSGLLADALAGDAGDFAALADPPTAEAFATAVIAPQRWPALPTPGAMGELYGLLRQPLPAPVSAAMLTHRDWRKPLNDVETTVRASLAAALVPLIHPSLRPDLRRLLETLPAPANRHGLNLLALHHILSQRPTP